jgi:hypothetical protein
MKTPHQIWHKSVRPYQEQTPSWEYPQGSEVKEVDSTGQVRLNNRRYYITKALAGRQVGLLEIEKRILALYRRTLVCELDSLNDKNLSKKCEGCVENDL